MWLGTAYSRAWMPLHCARRGYLGDLNKAVDCMGQGHTWEYCLAYVVGDTSEFPMLSRSSEKGERGTLQ